MSFLILKSFLLGLIQGITEFLPISSSGHLVIFESLFGLQASELGAFDIFLHFGTLIAIILYFKKEVWQMIRELLLLTKDKFFDKLIVRIVVATIPVGLVGFYAKDWLEGKFRQPFTVGLLMIITGAFFLLAERWPEKKDKEKTGIKAALIMGVVQIFGLLPGISRSGSVISGGLLSGVKRREAARFSFLMALPAIGGAVLLQTIDFFGADYAGYSISDYWLFYAVGFLTALASSFFAIKWVLRFFLKHELSSFSVYLFLVGVLAMLFL